MNKLKLLLIALLANFVENLVLLLFFGISVSKQTLIGSAVFALITILLYKLLANGEQ